MSIKKLLIFIILQVFMKPTRATYSANLLTNRTERYPNKMHYVVIKENFGETEFVHFSHAVENEKNPVGPFSGRKETIVLTKSIIGPLRARNASIRDHITKFISKTNKNILHAFSLPIKIKKQAVKTMNKVQSSGTKNKTTTKLENAVAVNFDFFDDTSKKITKNILEFVNKFGWSKLTESQKVDKDKHNTKSINITIKGTTASGKNTTLDHIKRQGVLTSSKPSHEGYIEGSNHTGMNSTQLSLAMESNCSCGVPTIKRFVSGFETSIRRFPWNVRIFFKEYDNNLCGGTIINHKYILTAAHCVMFTNPQELAVRVGHTDITDPGEVAEVKSVKIHSRYSVNKMGMFDIALLKLKESLTFTDKILPACLSNEQNFQSKRGIITSWGPISRARNTTDILRKAFVRILENHSCKRKSDYNAEDLHSSVICAGITAESCKGDTGSPLVHFDGKKHVIVGIKSWNIGCAQQRYPVIYTKVPSYYNWIKQKTKDSTYCSD